MDQFKAMQVFVDVADLGSLSAAANKLDMSRAMATRYIASLEKTLGVRLLHRSTRSLGVSSAGNAMLPYCRQILGLSEKMHSSVAQKDTAPQGLIRIASSVSFGQSYLAEAVWRFMDMFPSVSVEMVLTDRSIKLIEERIDFAIQITNELPPTLLARQLARNASLICASAAYLQRFGKPLSPADLAHANCLVHTRLGRDWIFYPQGSSAGAEPEVVSVSGNFSSNDVTALLHACMAGRGIACLPAIPIAAQIRSGALINLFPQYRLNDLGIYALSASQRSQSSASRALQDFITQDLAQKHS